MPGHTQDPLETLGDLAAAATNVDGLTEGGRQRYATLLVDAVQMNVIEDRTTRRHSRTPFGGGKDRRSRAIQSGRREASTTPSDYFTPHFTLWMYRDRGGFSKHFYTILWIHTV